MRFVIAAILLGAALVPFASAQDQAEARFEVFASLHEALPSDGTPGNLTVEWTYEALTAAAPTGDLAITWSLDDCHESLQLDDVSTTVPLVAGISKYSGTETLAVRASDTTPGIKAIPCTLSAVASTGELPSVTAQAPAILFVAFDGEVAFKLLDSKQSSGPQKIVRYAIELQNLGNARTAVSFEILDRPTGKRWNVILPDPVILDSPNYGADGKTTATTVIAVATPYHNGYVKDSGRYSLRLTTASADVPEFTGTSQDLELATNVKGWYVPGPEPALLFVGLAAVAAMRRRDV